MGQINIEGLGIVEIEGDEPNEMEQAAILKTTMADTPEPTETEIAEPVKQDIEPGSTASQVKKHIRGTVEEMPGLLQLMTEASPSIAGALGGAAVGSLAGPPGSAVGTVAGIAGAMAGGAGGEALAQETGVAPESDLNLMLSAASPLIGPAAGKTFQLGRRAVGFGISKLPPVAVARSRHILSQAVEEFESVGTRIFAKQKGLMAKTAGELYDAVRKSGVVVSRKELPNTRGGIKELLNEMDALRAFPEVDQAAKVIEKLNQTLFKPAGQNITTGKFTPAPDISLDTLVRARQLIGIAIQKAETGGGMKLGSAKKVFAAISDDMDKIANSPSLTGRAARLAKTATQRAKLEFSIKDLEAGVAKVITETKDGVTINIDSLGKWLNNVTNPKHAQYDKNFSVALKDELPVIKQRLSDLQKVITKGGSGGTQSLVLRGRLTSTAVGAMAGIGLGGPFGGVAGALIGTRIPEMLTAILSTPTSIKFLEKAVSLGTGQINMRTWMVAAELASHALGEKDKERDDATQAIKEAQTMGTNYR